MEPANILKIESLDSGWCDKDQVMLHACFQLLKDCIEKENLLNGDTDWEHDEKHRNAKVELTTLYKWWIERVKNDDEIDPLTSVQFDEDSEMLIRLINVRWALWT
ncbi:hypothetical protein ACFLXQ_06155 [Chloroflexota bacterium]